MNPKTARISLMAQARQEHGSSPVAASAGQAAAPASASGSRSSYFCPDGRFGRFDGGSDSRDERLAFTMAPDATREGASILSRSITFFFAMARRSPTSGSTVRTLMRFVPGLGGPSASLMIEAYQDSAGCYPLTRRAGARS
jgi:hypothetical protein